MTVIITTRFGSGGANLVPPGTTGTPALVDALRQIADDLAALDTRSGGVQVKLDSLIANFNGHRAAAGVHLEADSTNLLTAPVATDPVADILLLVNDLTVQYEAHRVLTAGSVHGAADATNVITATNPATTEAEGFALANDLKAMYEAHRVLTGGSEHGGADSTNDVTAADATDWDDLITLANDIRVQYEAHRVMTSGSVHGAADSTNVTTAVTCGVQVTALQVETNDVKDIYNLHAASLGVHPNPGAAEGTADNTTEATAVALVNALKATLNTHFADADVHLDADAVSDVTAADATEYEDILPIVVDLRAQYVAHIALNAVHAKADSGNAETVLGTGGAVTIGLVKG